MGTGPFIGQIVRFVVMSGVNRAGLICDIRPDGTCDIFVFSMPQDECGGFFMNTNTVQGNEAGQWLPVSEV